MGCASSKDIEIHDDAQTRPSPAPAGSRAAAKANATKAPTNTTNHNATSETTPTTTTASGASKDRHACYRDETPHACSASAKQRFIATVTTKSSLVAEAAHDSTMGRSSPITRDPQESVCGGDDDVFIELFDTQLMGTDSSAIVDTAPTSGRPTEGESASNSHVTPGRSDKPSCRCLFRGNAVHLRCSRPDHAARTRAWVAESQTRYSGASSHKQAHAESKHAKRSAFRKPKQPAEKLPLAPHEEPLFDMLF